MLFTEYKIHTESSTADSHCKTIFDHHILENGHTVFVLHTRKGKELIYAKKAEDGFILIMGIIS